jgi:hypothetical protein
METIEEKPGPGIYDKSMAKKVKPSSRATDFSSSK